MANKKEAYTSIPVEEREMEETPNPTETNQAEDELEERFDKDFWLKVNQLKSMFYLLISCLL